MFRHDMQRNRTIYIAVRTWLLHSVPYSLMSFSLNPPMMIDVTPANVLGACVGSGLRCTSRGLLELGVTNEPTGMWRSGAVA